jgi:hypothetical protein
VEVVHDDPVDGNPKLPNLPKERIDRVTEPFERFLHVEAARHGAVSPLFKST